MKKKDIISIIQDNDISEYYSLKNLGIEGYAFPYQEALKIVQICKRLLLRRCLICENKKISK